MKINSLLLAVLALGLTAGSASAQTSFPNATTYPPLIVPINSIGTAKTIGYVAQNPTAAASGAQQYSPGFLWEGQGWKTTSTAASKQVDFFAQVVPVQGSTAPTANWVLSAAIGGGSYTTVLTVGSNGTVTPGSGGFSGAVTSLAGTTNQITASASTGAVTLSIPSAFIAPGSIAATTTIGGTTITGTTAVLNTGTGGIGYGTGAGGAVTQGTDRTTTVVLNKPTGAITLVSAAGSATPATFTVTDSAVAATDTVVVNQKSGADLYEIFVTNVGTGSFKITSFTTGGTTTEQPVFNFAIIKASAN